MAGWIKLYRSLQESNIWADKEPFDKRSAWIDLLLMVNHEDKTIYANGKTMTISRGQRFTSTVKLAERWHWSVNRVRRFISSLEALQMVTTDRTANGITVTIVKYEFFQDGRIGADIRTDIADGITDGISVGITDGIQTRSKEEKKEERRINNNKRFVKPTVEEIKTYCQERHNNIDAQNFFDYYESKGWMIGKNHMKDWKASVRTWENRRKDETNGAGSTGTVREDEEQRNREIDEQYRRIMSGELDAEDEELRRIWDD